MIKLYIAVLFTISVLSPAQEAVYKMVESVYYPEKSIVLEGADKNGVTYLLKYDRLTDTLTETVGEKERNIPGKEMDLFLRLFFFQGDHEKHESLGNSAGMILDLLKEQGIDVEKTALSVSDVDGVITISVGQSRRFENADNLQLYRSNHLPASLQTGSRKILFSDYHKSQLPLVFPGRIDIFENGEQVNSFFFHRKEHRK